MVHGYHIILPHYGFWLPNDPRGSWSDFVASWELARFGETTRHLDQRTLAMLSADELAVREAARKALHYPPVTLTGPQALSIANGFKEQTMKSDYAINYVIENPIKEGKPRQNWKWITPYAGLEPGWTTYL